VFNVCLKYNSKTIKKRKLKKNYLLSLLLLDILLFEDRLGVVGMLNGMISNRKRLNG
jgi:hypothetical protein